MTDARDHLVLPLDVPDLETARARAKALAPWYATAKIGYELWAGVGPAAVDALHEDGFAVFVDLKLLDIPTTVERAARVLGRRGAEFVNLHAVGGLEMLLAGATAVGVGTATFADPRAPLRILAELDRWCVHHGVSRVADLTGALRPADREEPS